jgi:hypothetical protein
VLALVAPNMSEVVLLLTRVLTLVLVLVLGLTLVLTLVLVLVLGLTLTLPPKMLVLEAVLLQFSIGDVLAPVPI